MFVQSQSPNKKVCLVEGQPGVFRLVVSIFLNVDLYEW